MHQGVNYQDFLKWVGLLFGHPLIITKWTGGFFSQKFAIWPPPPTITQKRVVTYIDRLSNAVFEPTLLPKICSLLIFKMNPDITDLSWKNTVN